MRITVSIGFVLCQLFSSVAFSNFSSDLMLWRTLAALRNSLGFFRREYRNVNLDAVIGTRMVDGQLKVLLEREGKSDNFSIPEQLRPVIANLQQLAEDISDKAIKYVAAGDPIYYKRIGIILKKDFWNLDYPTRKIDMALVEPAKTDGESMHEKDSDNCLAELFGTRPFPTAPCRISEHCWNLMTSHGYYGYSLSHELFYLQIGKQFGCYEQMARKARSHRQASVERLEEAYCANMLAEATLIAKQGFLPHLHDLFMEQTALCGLQGYREFIKREWLEKILGWQTSRGCYTRSPAEIYSQPEAGHFERSRVKREEKWLPDGCLCHRTTVAAGALTQYVRYLLEDVQDFCLAGRPTNMRTTITSAKTHFTS